MLEFSQRCADELDPAEFLVTVLKLLTDAGLAPNGCERRIYELFRKGQPIPNARYTSLDAAEQAAKEHNASHLLGGERRGDVAVQFIDSRRSCCEPSASYGAHLVTQNTSASAENASVLE